MKPATSNLASRWGLPRTIIKLHPEEKVGVALVYGSSLKFWSSPLIFLQQLRLATSNLVCSLGLQKAMIKLHQEKKLGVAMG